MRKVSRRETPTLPAPYLHLPVFVESRLPLVEKERFTPTRGTGQEPLPEPVRKILLPARPCTRPSGASGVSLNVSCGFNRMHVQVPTSILGTAEPQSHLRLGTCRASKSTRDFIYFEYDLGLCGTKRTIINNQVAYSNTLHYDPPRVQGPIRRAMAFTLPVACYYNRYQYSYKIGYKPKMQMRRILKPMKNGAKFILTARNAQWQRLSPSYQYVLGKPMYFEAEALSMSQSERLYVHSCYVTPKKSHTSMPQFPIVKNFGCMVESKESRSRFIRYKNNAVRLSIDAFLFKEMTGQYLYMHCTMSAGSSVPTPTAKACNYDAKAGRWVELYGSESVCDCCDSSCSSTPPVVAKMISSRPWTIEPKVKPTRTPKREVVSTTEITTTRRRKIRTTRTTTTTTSAPPTPTTQPHKTTRQVTKRMTTSQPEATTVTPGKVEDPVRELEWPIRGGGVKWVEVESEERQEKGSAVVEEVTKPRRIFEDIFNLDK
ncbi:hypothetical protein PAMP_002742 [Pampus punctatissimus]